MLLLVDGSFGFEMETFEFLNLLQVHGFPKVMGVLTHLDAFRDVARLKKTKKKLKQRFWAEIYDGAKLFYLSGMQHGKGVGKGGGEGWTGVAICTHDWRCWSRVALSSPSAGQHPLPFTRRPLRTHTHTHMCQPPSLCFHPPRATPCFLPVQAST